MAIMTKWQKRFEEKMAELAEAEEVYDIGGGAQPADRRRFRKYVLVDVNATYQPDVVADIQKLPFASESIKAILCLDVLEHVADPFQAVRELHRVLKPGGKILASMPFIWPYHAAPPLYLDYWRFSPDGLAALFKDFSKVEIFKKGGYLSALANFIPSFTRLDRLFRPLAAILDERLGLDRRSTAPGHFITLIK
jgi:SAM-dependent methyltransferase